MTGTVKLLIVDMDGTLVNTYAVNYFAYHEALNVYGIPLEMQFYRENCNGRSYKDFLPSILIDGGILENDLYQIMEDVHRLKKDAYPKYMKKAILNQHLVSIIRALRNIYKISLVTTASKENCEQLLEYFGIRNHFDYLVTREDVTESKPSPEGFIKVMKHFGAEAKDTVIFEDSEVGKMAALQATSNVYMTYGYK